MDRIRKREPPPLTGAPEVRRAKLYTSETGYVYEYYFEGYRVAERRGTVGTEYVFTVSGDRRNWTPMAVFLGDEDAAAWERERERDLNATERYAVVKMRLFREFDAWPDPGRIAAEAQVSRSEVAELLDELGIE
jgi:hypothetical protein